MSLLTVQDLPEDGAPQPVFGAADVAGDEAPVGAGHFVVIKNDNLMARTVTFQVPIALSGSIEIVANIPAMDEFRLPLPVRNQKPHGGTPIIRRISDRATWTYSAVADVTVAALRAP